MYLYDKRKLKQESSYIRRMKKKIAPKFLERNFRAEIPNSCYRDKSQGQKDIFIRLPFLSSTCC